MAVDMLAARIDGCQYDAHATDPADRRLLLPARAAGAARRTGGGVAGRCAARPCRPGAASPGEPDRGPARRGGLRVQPDRAAGPLAADREPSPEGAARGGHPRARTARAVGVLPPDAGAAPAPERRAVRSFRRLAPAG